MKNTPALLLAFGLALAPAAPAGAQSTARVHATATERDSAARTVVYQRGSNAHEEVERTSHTLRIGAGGELDAANIAGNIVVTRGSGNDARVDVVKRARGRAPEDAREMLKLVTVSVTDRNGRGEVKAHYPEFNDRQRYTRRNLNVSVDYTIVAPVNTRITLHSISGDLKVTDIKGDLSLETISGNVDVANAGRISAAKSVSGDVTVANTEAGGGIAASSMSGTVTARGVRAPRLSLTSISGNVVMEDVTCDRADAGSMTGNVAYSGPMTKGGRYEFKSHAGDVRLMISGATGFEVDATTFSGNVRSDLPLTMRGGVQGGVQGGRRRSVQGTYGDGSAILNLTSFSGNVVIGTR